MPVRLPFAILILLVSALLSRAIAQTIQITSEVAVWPTNTRTWDDINGWAVANAPTPILLSGGDWLLASAESTRGSNAIPQVDRFRFERRDPQGSLKWRIERSATNTSFGEVAPRGNMVVTKSGLFHVFVGGSSVDLWTGTLEGALLSEDAGFTGRGFVGLYADNERLILSQSRFWDDGDACFQTWDLDASVMLSSFCRDGSLGFAGAPWMVGHADSSGYWLINQGGTLSKIGPNGQNRFIRQFKTGSGGLNLSHFRWLGDQVLLGGVAWGSQGNDLSQSFGQQDAWLIWTDTQGNRVRDAVYGGVGWETLGGWVQTEDGGFLLAIDSRGSGVSGNKTIDGDGVWLVKISPTGVVQGQRLIPNQLFLAIGSTKTGISLLVRDAATSKQVQAIQIGTEAIAKVRALSPEPYDLYTSTDLRTWRILGSNVIGEVEFSYPARETAQFYQIVPVR